MSLRPSYKLLTAFEGGIITWRLEKSVCGLEICPSTTRSLIRFSTDIESFSISRRYRRQSDGNPARF